MEAPTSVGDTMSKTLRSDGQIALIDALISARKKLGLSQTELAKRLRCHQSFVARIETGQRRIDVSELVILAKALEVEPSAFLDAVVLATPEDARI